MFRDFLCKYADRVNTKKCEKEAEQEENTRRRNDAEIRATQAIRSWWKNREATVSDPSSDQRERVRCGVTVARREMEKLVRRLARDTGFSTVRREDKGKKKKKKKNENRIENRDLDIFAFFLFFFFRTKPFSTGLLCSLLSRIYSFPRREKSGRRKRKSKLMIFLPD